MEAQLKSHREAQKRYRATEKGREAHRINERNRRMGRTEKTMADESTTPPVFRVIVYPKMSNDMPRCSFCGAFGIMVDVFPPR